MRIAAVLVAAALCCAGAPARAIEGSAAAGPIGGTDMPEHGMVAKLKVLTSGFSENAVRPFGVALTLAKKLY
jgi:hypothetical protein